jgi:DNA-directed RNA polymerase subunit H
MDTNSTVKKVTAVRYNLKKYLVDEWKTETILDLSTSEVESLYRSPKPINSHMQFGNASGCDFTLYHRTIPSHRIHIIHYNFPEIGKPSVKVNKTCAEKLSNLYKEGIIGPEDSLIIVFYNAISDNLQKTMEDMYLTCQEELTRLGISDSITMENSALGEKKLSQVHFRNIHVHHLDALAIDIMLHVKVPRHEIVRDQVEIDTILERCNARINQLPVILRTDPMAKRLRLAPGDICKITRITQTAGKVDYYRACK